jgi:hypothetical protein
MPLTYVKQRAEIRFYHSKAITKKIINKPHEIAELLPTSSLPAKPFSGAVVLRVMESMLPPSSLVIIYISPVLSLDMKRRPFESNVRPTGLKQLFGHLVRSGFVIMKVKLELLFAGATGKPSLNATANRV